MATRKILAGPSKWDLLIEALGHSQLVEFDFEGLGKWQVKITGVRPEDNSGESWLITGHLKPQSGATGMQWWGSFDGYYSTKRRLGTYTFTPAQ